MPAAGIQAFTLILGYKLFPFDFAVIRGSLAWIKEPVEDEKPQGPALRRGRGAFAHPANPGGRLCEGPRAELRESGEINRTLLPREAPVDVSASSVPRGAVVPAFRAPV